MMEFFDSTRRDLATTIRDVLAAYGAEYQAASADLGADAADRLAEFASRGKMLRGGLVRLGYEIIAGRQADGPAATAVRLAGAAMELFQSGLLVHDDIMDRDRVRRGFPTLHVGYESAMQRGAYDDPPHYGEALGVCAGDLAYFAAFRLLAELPTSAAVAVKAVAIAARELSMVGVAQMQDVVNGSVRPGSRNPFRDAPTEPSEDEILSLYRYKTGRYTFSLPLALGCALAGGSDDERLVLEEAGEDLGLVFQLKDDELGLFADEAVLGKPVGSDIREDKKTLHRLRLLAQAHGPTGDRLRSIFGNRAVGTEAAAFVRAELERLGVRAELAKMMRDRAEAALARARPLLDKAHPEAALAFRQLVGYSLERRS